jgi:hypothetical protein
MIQNPQKGERKMNDQSISDKFAAIVVALLLILTAWGNAMVMLIFATLGLVVYVLISRRNIARGGSLAATVGFIFAIGFTLMKLFL